MPSGIPKQHSMWAPVGPQLGKIGPRMGLTGAHLGMLLGSAGVNGLTDEEGQGYTSSLDP